MTGEQHFNEVVLDDVEVPDRRVIGEVGSGWRQVIEQLSFERGGAERVLSTYPLLGRLLAAAPDDSGARAVLGGLLARLGVLRRLAYNIARDVDAGAAPVQAAATLKYLAVTADADLAGDPLDRVDLSRLPRPEPLAQAPAAEAIVARAAVLSAAQLAGLADGALDLTRRYVRERHQFGAPLIKVPAVTRGLAEMRVRVTEAAAGVDAGIAGDCDSVAAAITFIATATAATAVARIAHQLHGAIGVTAEYSLHRWTTRMWSWRDWPRPQAEWTDMLGRYARKNWPGT